MKSLMKLVTFLFLAVLSMVSYQFSLDVVK
jgi:hypothetical protein